MDEKEREYFVLTKMFYPNNEGPRGLLSNTSFTVWIIEIEINQTMLVTKFNHSSKWRGI